MDRESLTLQIENMKFQSKMERWPLSKSIEAWVSNFSNFGINLLCDLLLLTFRVFHSQNWRTLTLSVQIRCNQTWLREFSTFVCFSLPQSDCVNYIDIKNIWMAGFLFLLFSFEFLYWTFQACHFLYQVKENNSFQCRWTFIFQEFTEMLFHLISFLGWKPSLKKMRNLTFWFIPLIRELIRGWKR